MQTIGYMDGLIEVDVSEAAAAAARPGAEPRHGVRIVGDRGRC